MDVAVKRTPMVLAFVVLLALAGWYFRDRMNADDATAKAAAPSKALAPLAAERGSASGSKIIVQAPTEGSLQQSSVIPATIVVDAASSKREPASPDQTRMSEMMSRRNFARLIAETANSDDAQLNALSLLLVDFCMSHTSAPAKAQAEAGGPPPTALRANSAQNGDGLRADATGSRRLDNARLITESCKEFNEGSGQSYADVALSRLTARGSNASVVFAELSPQLDYKALSPRQFSVIVDALNEKNMGVLALLGAQIGAALSAGTASGTASEVASGGLAWPLALCQIGAYCGRDSLAFREACWRYGACAGDDLASAARAAMVRDGLPDTALDKQVSLLVKAINTHDPELLGIRRK